MALNAVVDSLDDVPEAFKELYTERGGKFEITGIVGLKTQADVDRVNEALRKEREDHKKAKDALLAFNALGLKADEIQAKIDKFDELEVAATAAGKINDEQINQIVETRIKTRIAPVERAKAELETKLGEATNQITGFPG
jgi:hypothetical protein